MSTRRLIVLLTLLCAGCGDLLAYPIRQGRSGGEPPLGPAGPDDVYAPGPKAPSPAAPDPVTKTPTPSDGGPIMPGCRPLMGWDADAYCSGAAPKAAVDNKTVTVTDVRANGGLPTFSFDLLDAPARLMAYLGPPAQAPSYPSKRDLSRSGEVWDTRVWRSSCPPGPDCPDPRDWLSIARGDHLAGWVELYTDGDDRYASLCLAVTRGPSHDSPLQLPCTVVLYAPAVAIR